MAGMASKKAQKGQFSEPGIVLRLQKNDPLRHSLWVASGKDGNEYKKKVKESWLQMPLSSRTRWIDIHTAIESLSQEDVPVNVPKGDIKAAFQRACKLKDGKLAGEVPEEQPPRFKQKQATLVEQASASSNGYPADDPDQLCDSHAPTDSQLRHDSSPVAHEVAVTSNC
jgi:hypothetical protein